MQFQPSRRCPLRQQKIGVNCFFPASSVSALQALMYIRCSTFTRYIVFSILAIKLIKSWEDDHSSMHSGGHMNHYIFVGITSSHLTHFQRPGDITSMRDPVSFSARKLQLLPQPALNCVTQPGHRVNTQSSPTQYALKLCCAQQGTRAYAYGKIVPQWYRGAGMQHKTEGLESCPEGGGDLYTLH